MNAQDKNGVSKQLKVNEEKWSVELMSAGWTAIPSVIIERQQALGLDELDLTILLHLSIYWWTADSKPHPAKTTIATAMGRDPRTIQRRIAAMEHGGLIKRIERREFGQGSKGSQTNIYDFSGLIKAAIPYAVEKKLEIANNEVIRKARAARKGKANLPKASNKDV